MQVLLGLVRNERRTDAYRTMERYDRLKRAREGSERSIIATARVLSEIIWDMLSRGAPFDESWMNDREIRRKAMEMQASACDTA